MKVFISSVISDFGQYRDAATRGCQTLSHQVLKAEDYGASASSPQLVCLSGVRDADVVLVILGANYGAIQSSGLSATHEEFREARDNSRVLAFIQTGVTRDAKQEQFVREVQDWAGGLYTAPFLTTEELKDSVTNALHREELGRAVGPVDEQEMCARAEKQIVQDNHSARGPSLSLVIAGGPKQQILRPSELEKPAFQKTLRREALLGDAAVLDPSDGSKIGIVRDQLQILQDHNSITLDQTGTLCTIQSLRGGESSRSLGGMVLIEEDIQEAVRVALILR